MAEIWKKGLASWGQTPDRIAKFRSAVDLTIYTPGGNAGVPLTILKSFTAPSPALMEDPDAVRDRIMATVSGLLALLGIDADPIQSREHILLSNILDRAWKNGRDLDLAELIREIQAPPFKKLGVFDLESFYPSKERFALSMRLNNMLASPGFSVWMEGDPLDVGRLLYTPEGKPRLSILSIAHLSDAERMFFVTILLNEVIAWMRTQPGTSSLRALLYMDEVFGYFPPNANPPSKTPMLTLLKQARAFGLGCVLATQNPVDLDYKGLSNTGTWFVGRLQTERDKARLLDGLEGASGSAGKVFDRQEMEATLSSLGSRCFLMSNVHEDEPVLFQTRWVLSYLRGPLTRTQIAKLMTPKKKRAAAQPATPQPAAVAPVNLSRSTPEPKPRRPVVPPSVKQYFVKQKTLLPEGSRLVYRPVTLGITRLHFVRSRAKVDDWKTLSIFGPTPDEDGIVLWDEASFVEDKKPEFDRKAVPEATFAELSPHMTRAKNYRSWKKHLKDYLYQNRALQLWKCPALKAISKPGETEGDFRVRLKQQAREKRDLAIEKLRKRYSTKLASLRERVRKAQVKIEKEKEQYSQSKLQTAVSVGTTLLGALFGRKAVSVGNVSRAGTAIGRAGRTAKEKGDIAVAQQNAAALKQRLMDLESQFEEDVADIRNSIDPDTLELEELAVRPRKSDITISAMGLAWTPWKVDSSGIAEPLF